LKTKDAPATISYSALRTTEPIKLPAAVGGAPRAYRPPSLIEQVEAHLLLLLNRLRLWRLCRGRFSRCRNSTAAASTTAAATAAAAAATPAVAGKAGPTAGGGRPGPSPEQITFIKQAIANAASLDEVAKLEKLLKASDYDAIAKHLASEAAEGTLDDGGDGEADATEANSNGGDRGIVDGEEEQAAAAPEAPDAPPDDMET